MQTDSQTGVARVDALEKPLPEAVLEARVEGLTYE
jgi:hypothetical protein